MSKSKIKKFKGLYYYYQIVCPDGVRRPIYFAKGTTEKQFITCRNKIDCMLQALRLGMAFDNEVQQWLIKLDDKMRTKLKKLKLINITQEREGLFTVGGWCDHYYEEFGHSKALKDKLRPVIARLKTFFGADKLLNDITQMDCIKLSQYISKPHKYGDKFAKMGLGEGATRPKHIQMFSQIFDAAIDEEIVAKQNPFKVRGKNKKNKWLSQKQKAGVFQEVPDDIVRKVLDELPDEQWRLRFLLMRYMGLRPSELNTLRWSGFNSSNPTLHIYCKKTAHIDGKEERICCVFPEVLPALMDAFDAAPVGDDRILIPKQIKNMGEVIKRAIKRAGVKQWPKVHNQLRKNAVSDAHSKYSLPEHVLDEWFGHDKRVSDKNYKNVTSLNFAAVWPNGTEVPQEVHQQSEDASRTEKQEEMLGERHRPKNKQKPVRGGRNWQPQVLKSRPGRTRTADQGIMSADKDNT